MKTQNLLQRRQFLGRVCFALLTVAVCQVTFPTLAHGADSTDAQKKWDSLSESEKQALRDRWAAFKAKSPAEQDEIRAAQARFQGMSEQEKSLVRKNFEQWKKLSPEDQKVIRDRYAQWKSMTEDQKAEFRANHKAFQDLADEEQKRLLETEKKDASQAK
jgi:hypothetical protein